MEWNTCTISIHVVTLIVAFPSGGLGLAFGTHGKVYISNRSRSVRGMIYRGEEAMFVNR